MLIIIAMIGRLTAQEDDDPLTFTLDGFSLSRLPGGWFAGNLFENLAPDTVSLIEESNGFSLIDPGKVYFEGDSPLWFRWYLGGFPIHSSLEPGAAAVSLPFSALDGYRLRGESPSDREAGFSFVPAATGGNFTRIQLSTIYPHLGGYWKFGESMLAPHAVTRSPDLYTTRRKPLANLAADLAWQHNWEKSSLLASVQYLGSKRQFNDFHLPDTVFAETGSILSAYSRYRSLWLGGAAEIQAAVRSLERSHDGAEFGRYPEETQELNRKSGFVSLSWQKNRFTGGFYAMLENERRHPIDTAFAKDLEDIDGEGFMPCERSGTVSSSRIGISLKQTVASWLHLYAEGDQTGFRGDETGDGPHPLLWEGIPYQVILWEGGKPYRNQAYNWLTGIRWDIPLGRSLALIGRAAYSGRGIRQAGEGRSLHFRAPEFDAGLRIAFGEKARLLIAFGHSQTPFAADLPFFLAPDRPSGSYRYWDDLNGDRLFQDGEEGDLFGLTGSPVHRVDPVIETPLQDRFLLAFSTPISRNFRFQLKGIYKWFHNPLAVRYAEEYGTYRTVDGIELFVLESPFTSFLLTNGDDQKDPFYAQLHLRLFGGRKDRWFFSFSFLAHIGMGVTAFGNGIANDIGVIDESMADPNSRINGYGRLDGDRAFVGRIYGGWYLLPRFFLAGSIKYRDGNPFAFIDHYQVDRQHILVYKTIKAEDEKGVKGGPREDCLWDFHFQATYEFSLGKIQAQAFLAAFNLFDFGSELSENVFSGGYRRANELQLARTLRLGLTLGW